MPATQRPHNRSIDFAGCLLMLAITWCGFRFGASPILQAEAEEVQLSQNLALETRAVQEVERQLRSLEHSREESLKELGMDAEILEPASRLNQRLSQLSSIAVESGFVVESTRSFDSSQSEWYQVFPIELTATGSFEAGLEYLDQLHDRIPTIEVTLLEVTSTIRAANVKPRWSFQMRWYSQRPN